MSVHENEQGTNLSHAYSAAEEETVEVSSHRRLVRKAIEDKLERKRLRDEIDELDGDFNWDEL